MIEFDAFIVWMALGLLATFGSGVMFLMWKINENIAALNEKVAVIIAKQAFQDEVTVEIKQRLTKLEGLI